MSLLVGCDPKLTLLGRFPSGRGETFRNEDHECPPLPHLHTLTLTSSGAWGFPPYYKMEVACRGPASAGLRVPEGWTAQAKNEGSDSKFDAGEQPALVGLTEL